MRPPRIAFAAAVLAGGLAGAVAHAVPLVVLEPGVAPPELGSERARLHQAAMRGAQGGAFAPVSALDLRARLHALKLDDGCYGGPCAAQVTRALGAAGYVSTAVTQSPRGFAIDAHLFDADGKVVGAREAQACDGCTLGQAAERVVRAVRDLLVESGPRLTAGPPGERSADAAATSDEEAATSDGTHWKRTLLKDLGWNEYVARKWRDFRLTLHYHVREDHPVAAAHLKLAFVKPRDGSDAIGAITIRVNGIDVKQFPASDLSINGPVHDVEIDARALGAHNEISFVITPAVGKEGKAAECLPAGAWSFLRPSPDAVLETQETVVAGPNDLAFLPMPFFDSELDKKARVALVFAATPPVAELRAAWLMAAFFGLAGTQELTFPVYFGALPGDSAVVFGTHEELARLGVQRAGDAPIQMINHPSSTRPDAKLVLITGRDVAELTAAVERFVVDRGEKVRADYGPVRPVQMSGAGPLAVDDRDRLAPGRAVQFAELAGGDKLVIPGHQDGQMRVRFRLAPGSFFWPQSGMPVTLVYDQVIGDDERQSKMVVSLNGRYVTTFQKASGIHSAGPKEARFRLPQAFLGARNEMVIYSEFEPEPECPASHPDEKTVVSGESYLDLRNATEFATMPDLSRLAWEGYPFTRKANLEETSLVLPDRLSPDAVSAIAAAGALLARGSGYPGLKMEFITAAEARPGLDRDLLVFGTFERQPLLRQWASEAPVLAYDNGIRFRPLTRTEWVLQRIAGRDVDGDIAQAMFAYQGARGRAGLVESFESPLKARRTIVAVTATRDEALPNLTQVAASRDVSDRRSDVALVVPGKVHTLRVGGSYGVGELGYVRQALWFFSLNSFLLVPLLIVGGTVLARLIMTYLKAREKERLA